MRIQKAVWKFLHPGRRYGNWQLSAHGRKLYVLDPRPEDFFIDDIAHGLSNCCRFAGATKFHYSVGQHLLLTDAILRYHFHIKANWVLKQGFSHDFPEFCALDIPAPWKSQLKNYKYIDACIWQAMCKQFNITGKFDPLVKQADTLALMTERKHVLNHSHHAWKDKEHIQPLAGDYVDLYTMKMTPEQVRDLFLKRWNELH